MNTLYDYAGNEIGIDANIEDNSVTREKLSPVLRNSLYVTPEMYGAVGDGVADDTQAVKSAINQGGLVLLNKIYRCTSGVSISKPNTIIDGMGTIIGDFATNGSVIGLSVTAANMRDHIRIKNITIKSASTGTHNGIYCGHQIESGDVLTDVIIDGVKIIDVTGNGIHLHGGPYNSSYLRPFIKVRNCRILNAGQIGICQSRVSSIIEGNYVENSALENITIDNGCSDVIVTGNEFARQRGGAGNISADEAENCIISDNLIINKPQSEYNTEWNSCIMCNCNTGDVLDLIVNGNTLENGKYGITLGNSSTGYKGGGIFTNNVFKSIGTSEFYDKNIGTCIKDNNLIN